MKKLTYIVLIIIAVFTSCNYDNGELVGVQGREDWYQPVPYGMLLIPQGSYTMGNTDQDVPNSRQSKTKVVSLSAFYMDQTEITNNEYRQFVNWVKDSIARRILGEEFPDLFLIPTYDDDLSERDPTSLFNLFGLLPYDVPSFLMIGAWPIAMGVSMFIQQKLNPAPTDPMQAKIFMFFPLFLTVILAPFPAGLVVYWTVNNILTMAQQVFIMKRTTIKTTTT